MTDRYDVARLDDLARVPIGDKGLEWRPIRRAFGIRAFGTNAYTSSRVGGEIVEEHTEEQLGHEELYLVVRGHATFHLDGNDVDAPAGTFVVLRDPSVKRSATALDANTVVLAVGGKPGEAFKPSAWESYFSAAPLADEGRFDEAIALMEADAETYPEHAGFLYNLACLEARAGRSDDALEHLSRAVALEARFAGYAADDPDFASVRGDPRFNAALERRAT